MTTALQFRSFLLEDSPPAPLGAPPNRCPAADTLRREWWNSPAVLRPHFLGQLQDHMALCLQCIRRNAYFARHSALALLPERSIAEMESA